MTTTRYYLPLQQAGEAEAARAAKEVADRAEYERLRTKFEGNHG